ncbi:MAG TPA: flagellar motor protein MotB, partial [Burkholderiaceae bacterium]|nr:flagellar motor protein MotB [Burkholderiaceae bacterium]
GIASYFKTPLQVALGGGSGAGDSSSIIKGGGTDISRINGNARRGDIEADQKRINLQALKDELAKLDAEKIRMLRMRIENAMETNAKLKAFRSQVRIDITRDGLRIQIVDDKNRPMFNSGSAIVNDYMRDILREIGSTLNEVDNRITLSGHTDAAPYAGGERGYSNWELSADRANASRRELVAGGMDERKIVRVIGLASSSLLNRDDALDPTNRRISIIVLTAEALERLDRGTDLQASDADSVRDAVGITSSQASPEPNVSPANTTVRKE